jgi:chromosomal replication initiation ATPase DnaA
MSAVDQTTRQSTPELAERAYTPLNPKYTFETFIVGNSNRFPRRGARRRENPGGRATRSFSTAAPV